MSQQKQTDRQYVNLLVFAVISGIVSIAVMIVLMTVGGTNDTIQQLTPVIVTIEAGLLLIISFAIYTSVRHILRLKESENGLLNSRLQVTTCPDYWTLTSHDNNGNRVCTNTFVDPLDPKTTYTILGNAQQTVTTPRTVRLSEYKDKTVREACGMVALNVKSPWHSIDALCPSSL